MKQKLPFPKQKGGVRKRHRERVWVVGCQGHPVCHTAAALPREDRQTRVESGQSLQVRCTKPVWNSYQYLLLISSKVTRSEWRALKNKQKSSRGWRSSCGSSNHAPKLSTYQSAAWKGFSLQAHQLFLHCQRLYSFPGTSCGKRKDGFALTAEDRS